MAYTHPGVGRCNVKDLAEEVRSGSIRWLIRNTGFRMIQATGVFREEVPIEIRKVIAFFRMLADGSLAEGSGCHVCNGHGHNDDVHVHCPCCNLWAHDSCLQSGIEAASSAGLDTTCLRQAVDSLSLDTTLFCDWCHALIIEQPAE